MHAIRTASSGGTGPQPQTLDRRIDAVDWSRIVAELDAVGFSRIPSLLHPAECADMIALYSRSQLFRSKVIMNRHGFGSGEYQYFTTPLPGLVATLRGRIYCRLVEIANRWSEKLGTDARYPGTLSEFSERCRSAGQDRPTPLLLKYREGDFNRLHRDLYGEHVFPVQLTVLLSAPHHDFRGGEFVLTEQRPRLQSRAHVVPLECGDAILFAVNVRPATGSRGTYRTQMRHGVSTVLAGERYALGVIFHDAS